MSKFSIDLTGHKELIKALDKLPSKVEKKIFRKSMRQAMKIILKKVKARVPKDTGRLKKSLKVRSAKRSRTGFGMVIRTGTREELGVDPDTQGYYPAAIEYGSEHNPAQPYLRTGFDAGIDEAEETMIKALNEQLAEEAKKP